MAPATNRVRRGRRRALGDQRRRAGGGVRDDRRVRPRRLRAEAEERGRRTVTQHPRVSGGGALHPGRGNHRWSADATNRSPAQTTEGRCRPKRAVSSSARSTRARTELRPASRQRRVAGWSPGASLSADGSTVAWMGEDVGEQAQMLPGESPSPLLHRAAVAADRAGLGNAHRAGDGRLGPAATRRAWRAVSSAAGPASPSDPCQGPFYNHPKRGQHHRDPGAKPAVAAGDSVPRLSADGNTVAFICSALPVATRRRLRPRRMPASRATSTWSTCRTPRLTRDQALTPLTEIGGADDSRLRRAIADFDISPDGDQVAFTTARTSSRSARPRTSAPRRRNRALTELFDVDLARRHAHARHPRIRRRPERTAPPIDGAKGGRDVYEYELSTPSAGALSPSFSADGDMLAFSSTASNLVYGDGNTPPAESAAPPSADGSDAFVVQREAFAPLPTPQYISPAPSDNATPRVDPGRDCALARRRQRRCSTCRCPAPGTLYAAAPRRGAGRVRVRALGRARARGARSTPRGPPTRDGRHPHRRRREQAHAAPAAGKSCSSC